MQNENYSQNKSLKQRTDTKKKKKKNEAQESN